jgi:myosin heavy subunit
MERLRAHTSEQRREAERARDAATAAQQKAELDAEEMRNSVVSLQRELDEANAKVESHWTELCDVRTHGTARLKKAVESADQLNKDLNAENRNKDAELAVERARYIAKAEEHTKEIAVRQKQNEDDCARLKAQMEEGEQKLKAAHLAEVEQLEANAAELKRQLEAKTAQLEAKNAELAQAAELKRQLEAKAAQLEAKNAELAQAEAKASMATTLLEQAQKKLAADLASAEAKGYAAAVASASASAYVGELPATVPQSPTRAPKTPPNPFGAELTEAYVTSSPFKRSALAAETGLIRSSPFRRSPFAETPAQQASGANLDVQVSGETQTQAQVPETAGFSFSADGTFHGAAVGAGGNPPQHAVDFANGALA